MEPLYRGTAVSLQAVEGEARKSAAMKRQENVLETKGLFLPFRVSTITMFSSMCVTFK